MGTRIVLFGTGNPSRGDDALGPLLLERAVAWLSGQPGLEVDAVADFQLQVEHALDLQGSGLALFLDADVSCAGAYALRRVVPCDDQSHTTHELSPGAVLLVCRRVIGEEPPPAFSLGVRGERFELGEPLSASAARHLDAAWTCLQQLLLDGRPEAWAELAG